MKRLPTLTLLLAFAAVNIAAAQNVPPPSPSPKQPPAAKKPDPTKDAGERKLSRRERKERRKELAEKYQQFLIEVEPIMMPTELDAFLLLESDAQRDLYIEDFWLRRDPDPKTMGNEYRERYGELLELVRAKYKNTSSDPARVLLLKGAPAEVIRVDCERLVQPLEVWFYPQITGIGRNVMLLFYKPRTGIGWRLWTPLGSTVESLSELLSISGQELGVEEVFFGQYGGMRGGRISFECRDGDRVFDAINWADRNKFELGKLWEAPKINEEDVGRFLRSAVIANPDAPKLDADFTAAFPGKRGGRTTIELTILVDRAKLTAKELNGSTFFNLDVVGEVLRDEKLFEKYRYRYDIPGASAGEKIPIVIERHLRPNDYTARVKVVDVNSGAETIIEKPLVVPPVQSPAPKVTAAEQQQLSEALQRLQDDYREGESRIRIVPLGNDMVTGLQKIETLVTGDAISAVEFYLDKKKVMTKRTPPYELELDFGAVPKQYRVRAVGLNTEKKVVAGDEIVINTGTDPFRVHIVTPRVVSNVHGKVRVEVEASVPDGRELEKIEIFLNETRLATLFDPPFVQTIDVPRTREVGYIRAVATLVGEKTIAEDFVFINAPEFMEEVEVHLIELPVSVFRDGKPVSGLTAADFKVLDEGKPAAISKFEYVTNLPLSIGIAVDTSASMRPKLEEAQKAGAEFFKNVLRPGDKAFIIGFDEEPRMLQKWTSRLSDLNAGLSGLRAEASTALYDAIVLALYNFLGVKGQRALVLLSDGEDTGSKFTFEQTLEYAKRTGVPIYVVAIGVSGVKGDVRLKLARLANETGGSVYHIDQASELGRIYKDIQQELRSQYVIGIHPPQGTKPGSKWREVSVSTRDGKVKTIRGYYP